MRTLRFVSAALGAAAIATALVATPASAATDGAATLKAAGIDAAKLAPGWKVDGDEVVWNGGTTKLSLSPMAPGDCDANYVCLWQHRDFNGRRLQFQSAGLKNLVDYGFNDQMSSWYNRRGVDARWYYNIGSGTSRCMQAGARSSYVGSGDNDEATSLRIYTSASAC
ncbi:peptidase inhibitor family I36 protein [Amycolatopsis sp. NPDC058340]|uniref:peptidase inhibitor family I36 protein n=1 Tax=Amycolatopsis sp. NPDC058340 TaxID=3346453 RepID=UPI0036579DA3